MQKLPLFIGLPRDEQKSVLEAIIFASDEVVNYKMLYKLLITNETVQPIEENDNELDFKTGEFTIDSEIAEKYAFTPSFIDELIAEINQDLINTGRPFHIVGFAGGYQFATLSHYGEYIHNLLKARTKRRLSQASMETLAIIAYKQPITKPEIEQIRGVNSNEVVNTLIEKNLVKIAGRKDVLGKPLLYATTNDFLKTFGLRSIEDLPKLKEIEEIANELTSKPQEDEDVTFVVTQEDTDNLKKRELKEDEDYYK